MTPLSGRTPRALRAVLTEWPLVSAPMAEALTGASRAAQPRLDGSTGIDRRGDRTGALPHLACHLTAVPTGVSIDMLNHRLMCIKK